MTLVIEAPEQRLFARSESSRTGIEAVVLCDSLRRVLYDLPDSRSRSAFDTLSRQIAVQVAQIRMVLLLQQPFSGLRRPLQRRRVPARSPGVLLGLLPKDRAG